MKRLIVTFLMVISLVASGDMIVSGGAFIEREVAKTRIGSNSIGIYIEEEGAEVLTGNIRKINGAVRINHGGSGLSPYISIRGDRDKLTVEETGGNRRVLFTVRRVDNELWVYRGGTQVRQVMRLKSQRRDIVVYRNRGRRFPIGKMRIERGAYSDAEIIGVLLHTGILK